MAGSHTPTILAYTSIERSKTNKTNTIMAKPKKTSKPRHEKYIKVAERKGVYYFTVQFYYDTPTGKAQYSKSFCSSNYRSPAEALNQAVIHRDEVRASLRMGALPAAGKRTVDDVWNNWKKAHVVPSSGQERNETNYKRIRERFGNYDIKDITPVDITAHLETLKLTCTDEVLKRIMVVWRKIMKQALMEGLIVKNPLDMVTVPRSEVIAKTVEKVCDDRTVDEMIRLFREAPVTGSKRYFYDTVARVITVATNTGMRPGEIYSLTMDDVDLNSRMIHVQSRAGTNEKGLTVRKRAKTNQSVRYVPMNSDCEAAIREAIDNRRSEYLFTYSTGRLLDTHEVAREIKRVACKHGLVFNLYMCRHNVASKLVTSNVDPRTVMELLGHASMDMTVGVYARSTDELKERAVALVEIGRKPS